jgi:archaellum component FlaC
MTGKAFEERLASEMLGIFSGPAEYNDSITRVKQLILDLLGDYEQVTNEVVWGRNELRSELRAIVKGDKE